MRPVATTSKLRKGWIKVKHFQEQKHEDMGIFCRTEFTEVGCQVPSHIQVLTSLP